MLKRLIRRRKPDIASVALSDLIQQTDRLSQRIKDLETAVRNLKREVQVRTVLSQQKLAALSIEELRSISRAACQTAYLGNDRILCRVLGKYLVYANAQDTDLVPHLCLNGFWEPRLTIALLKILQPNWYCLDVGANHGYYTLVMADAVGSAGRVLALEPNYHVADLVQQSIEVNGFIDRAHVQSVAAAAQPGETVHLVVPSGKTGRASIKMQATGADEVIAVETVTIDQLTADWERLDLIKVDAEGAELEIWQGMQHTLQRHPTLTLILEFAASRYADAKGFLDEIQAVGFALRHVDQGGEIKALSIDECLHERPNGYWDLFLTRQV
ncbi:MAG: FkbM family methyltransferase [Elainella sp. Prado103]|jgi:FkbM family methyltransferase|nr:FkbM family methyltransferase [Elainella sp. Prado103]